MVLRRHFAKTTKGRDLMLQPPSSSSASASTMHMNASSISSSSAPPSFTATPHPRTNSSDATSTLRDGRTVSVTATTTTNNNTNSVTATDEKSKAAYSDASNLFHDIIALTDNHHYPHRTTAPNTDFVNEKLLFHQLNSATDSTTIASTTIADSNNSTHTSSSYDQKTKNGDGLFLFDAINSAATTQYPTKSGNNDEKNSAQVVDQATKRKKDYDDGRGNAVPEETTTTTKVLYGPLNDMIDGKSTCREERMFDAMGDLAAGNNEDEPTKDNSTAPVAAPLDPPLHMNNETSSLVSWTIQDVAEWVLMNGGSDVEAANVHAHRIDGEVIMAVSINELIQAITHGSPRRNPEELREALLRLKDSQLPSYDQFLQSS
ncbi:hypothetical protein BDR26DRAFT_863158 [Obelidium mucronatum]|nr:hypothetical protein BDR26DRAFT_863158 [Obelidium mucronatum]